MKNKILMLCIAFVVAGFQNARSQTNPASIEVPSAVKSAFSSKFPGQAVIKWEKEGANYEAEFMADDVENSAVFTAAGQLLETEKEIDPSALPATAREWLSKKYPSNKILEAVRIESSSGKVTYEAEVGHRDFLFDNTGKPLPAEKGSKGSKGSKPSKAGSK